MARIVGAARVLGFCCLLLAAAGNLGLRWVLADCAAYRPALEQAISAASGLPARIGVLRGRMHHLQPMLVIDDLSLGDPAAPAMRVREAELGVYLRRWLLGGDFGAAVWVRLLGAEIRLLRLADGTLTLKGAPPDGGPPDWLLSASSFQLADAELSVEDLSAAQRSLTLSNLSLALQNLSSGHRLRLDAELPPAFGERLSLLAELEGDFLAAGDLNGRVYARVTNLQAGTLPGADGAGTVQWRRGALDAEVWSDWRGGELLGLSGAAKARDLALSAGEAGEAALEQVQAGFGWRAQVGGWRLGLFDIAAEAEGEQWQGGEFYAGSSSPGQYAVYVKQLELGLLMRMAGLRQGGAPSWAAAKPEGILRDARFWLADGGERYAGSGSLRQGHNAVYAAWPALANFNADFSLTEQEGALALLNSDLGVDAPGIFRQPLSFSRLDGVLGWRRRQDEWRIMGRNLQLAVADFTTRSDFNLVLGQSAPDLDLRGQIEGFKDLSRVPFYLPAKIMRADALDWMDHVFVSGGLKRGDFVVRGDPSRIPFDQGEGRFDILLAVEDVQLHFNPEWPDIEHIQADVHFLGPDLHVYASAGASGQLAVQQAWVTVPDLMRGERVLVRGRLDTPLRAAVDYLLRTPLRPKAEPAASGLRLGGECRIWMDLDVPFDIRIPPRARVRAQFAGAEALVAAADLPITEIQGAMYFTENGVDSEGLTAKIFGRPVQARLSNTADAMRLEAAGTVDMPGLVKQFAYLDNVIASGEFAYRALYEAPDEPKRPATLSVESNLRGLKLEGEDYLSKSADQERAFKLFLSFEDNSKLPIRLSYGAELQAALVVDTAQDRLYSVDGVLGGGEAHPLAEPGLSLTLRRPEFKLASAFAGFSQRDPRWPPLRRFSLDTEQLNWSGRLLGPVHFGLRRDGQVWRAEVDSAFAKGVATVPEQLSGNQPIALEMQSLNLSALAGLDLGEAEEAFTGLPTVQAESKQLLWRGVNLGKLSLQSERLDKGVHFHRIKISGPGRELNFTGDWVKQAQGATTLLDGEARIQHFGQLLADLGFTQDLRETQAELHFTGGWEAAPYQFSLGKLNGQLHVNLSNGGIASIEPGVGRLLGLISMEQWAKRLSLDFSDVYRQGLAFDAVSGDVRITNGVAYTDNLLIDAVSAKMSVLGSANLTEKTLEQRVVVAPKSSDALPIAGTIVDGLAEIITNTVSGDYKEGFFFGSEYRLSGRWGDIQVTRVNEQDGLVNRTWRGLTDFGWLK